MTTTVTTVTVTSVNALGVSAALGLLTSLAFIVVLVAKELASAGPDGQQVRWGRTLNIAMVPLLLSFGVIALERVASTL